METVQTFCKRRAGLSATAGLSCLFNRPTFWESELDPRYFGPRTPYLTFGTGAQGTPALRPQSGPNAQGPRTCPIQKCRPESLCQVKLVPESKWEVVPIPTSAIPTCAIPTTRPIMCTGNFRQNFRNSGWQNSTCRNSACWTSNLYPK